MSSTWIYIALYFGLGNSVISVGMLLYYVLSDKTLFSARVVSFVLLLAYVAYTYAIVWMLYHVNAVLS